MAVITLKMKDIEVDFPQIIMKRKTNDKHKKRQAKSLHETGQSGLGREIKTLVGEARIRFKDGRQ